MKLSWREGEEVSVADEAELDRALDNIERAADHELPMISLTAPSGSQLHAGIGNEDASTLVYFPPRLRRRRVVALGR